MHRRGILKVTKWFPDSINLRARTVMQSGRAPLDTAFSTFSSPDIAGASDRCTGSPSAQRWSESASTAARSRP